MRRPLRPGGRVLLGDTAWDVTPAPAAQQALDASPDDFPGVACLVEEVAHTGFEPGHGHVSTLADLGFTTLVLHDVGTAPS